MAGRHQALGGNWRIASRTVAPDTAVDSTSRVAVYEYRRGDCGIFERSMPMGTATRSASCPTCGRDANPVFSVPMT